MQQKNGYLKGRDFIRLIRIVSSFFFSWRLFRATRRNLICLYNVTAVNDKYQTVHTARAKKNKTSTKSSLFVYEFCSR